MPISVIMDSDLAWVRALDKADANADTFQRSIISEAIYHFTF